MMRVRRFLWALLPVLIVSLFALQPVQAQAPGGGTVVGQVTHGTPGGTLPDDLPVALWVFDADGQATTLTTTLAPDGTFTFEGLAASAGQEAVARVVYRDVVYESEPVRLDAEAAAVADVRVFETSEDRSAVRIDQAHLFIIPIGDSVQVVEVVLIGNTGQHTYIGSAEDGGERTTLDFALPPAATGLSFDGPGFGERYVGDPVHFSDTQPVPPGTATTEVSFGYELPGGAGVDLLRAWDVPVASLVVMVAGDQVLAADSGLTYQGEMDTQMGPTSSYVGGPLAAGESLTLRLVPPDQGAPAPGAPVGTASGAAPAARDPQRELVLGLGALAVAGVVAYRLWRPSGVPAMPEAARAPVAELAALDERYERGEVTEEAYWEARAALWRRVRLLLGQDEDRKTGA